VVVAVITMVAHTVVLLKTVQVADKHLILDKTVNQLLVAVTAARILAEAAEAANMEQTAALGLL
jgi:hypothetical protein